MEVKEILDEARQYVERGWTQYKLVSDDGLQVCALGALGLASGTIQYVGGQATYDYIGTVEDRNNCIEASNILMSVIRESNPEGFGIATWNNNPARTQEDVILAFKQASYNCEKNE